MAPVRAASAAASPWFGWGVGAGNAIIPPDSELARIIQSWAAHNEYLRISVEGGQFGRALLIVLFVLPGSCITRGCCVARIVPLYASRFWHSPRTPIPTTC